MKKGILPLVIMLCICIMGFFGCQQPSNGVQVSLTVYSTNVEIYENETHQIKYEYNGQEKVKFTTNDSAVATVSDNGVVTAVSVGTVFIDVSCGDLSKLISVKVIEQSVAISLDKENINVAKDSEQYITANVKYGTELVSSGIEWTVSSNDLSLVSNGSIAKIKSARTGYYTVTASYKGQSATCQIKIVEKNAVKLETPIISVSNCDTITWTSVANAEAYQVKINGGAWKSVNGLEYSLKELSDNLKKSERIEVMVKAVAENNFSVMDSNHKYVEFAHDFTEIALSDYDCVTLGTVKFTCSNCDREYTQEKYSKGHTFVDGVCVDCDALQVPGITYEYHEETNSYWVKSATSSVTPEVTYVAGTYDDGIHGKLPVTHIGTKAFTGNDIIEKVYLPESIKTIYPGAFEGCRQLWFISMVGVNEIDGFDGQANHFLGDVSLTTAIVSAGFNIKTQAFNDYYEPNYVPQLDFYVTSIGSITAYRSSQNSMISNVIYYYDETGSVCNSWKYGRDGEVVVNYSHSYGKVDGKFVCIKCGEYYDAIYEYEYNESTNSYFVKGFKVEGKEEVTGILTEYNDGVHGVLPVKGVGRSAFANNTKIKKAILPDCIEYLSNDTFAECTNLTYVAMPGVTYNEYALTGGNHFINCAKLKVTVLGPSFYSNCQMWFSHPNPAETPVTDIYLSSTDGKFEAMGNQDLLTGNIYYYDETGSTCGTWCYNEERTDVILNSEHKYSNGTCSKCGAYDPGNYTYAYDLATDTYTVMSYAGNEKVVVVKSEFNDGMHGVLPVGAIGKGAFKNNLDVTKIILPNSVKTLGGSAFRGCTALTYVDASGVTVSTYDTGNDFIFTGCPALEVVIFGDSFDMSGNARVFDIDAEEGTVDNPILDIYLTSADGVFKSNSYPQRLLSGKVYHYEETGNMCGTWKYNSDKTGVILNDKAHSYLSGKCINCGIYDGKGVEYIYDENTDSYVVTKYNGTDAEVIVYSMFNDGVNGEKAVTAVKNNAFVSNNIITKVVLPESITKVYGAAFSSSPNLKTVIMPGVTKNIYSETGCNQFYNCTSLEVVVFGASFETDCQYFIFDAETATIENKKILDIYLLSADGKFKYDGNQDLWSGNIYYYEESGKTCGTWSFNEDKTDIVFNNNDHEYENGKCKHCGVYDSKGVNYIYDEKTDSYVVSGYVGTDAEVIVYSMFDDGVNGEKTVTSVKSNAFVSNNIITKVVLPESITKVYGAAFSSSPNLKTVIMPGVTRNIYAETGANQFYNCVSLEVVVLGSSFETNCQYFIYDQNFATTENKKILDIYFSSTDGSFKHDGNQELWSGNIYYYDETGVACQSWKFNDDKTDVVVNENVHEFVDGACVNCDADQTVGINYVFDAELGGYVVYKSLNGEHVNAYSGTDKVVYVRAYYNDGVNGKKPVVAVGNKAFKDNKTIEKVILPASVTLLTNNAFSGCTSLTYVDARGWENSTYSAKLLGKNVTCDHIFGGCNALETIILGKSFDMSGNAWVFDSETAPSPAKLDILLSSSNGTFKSNTYTQRLLSGKVYHYNANGGCGFWKYNADKTDVEVTLHTFKDGACVNCDADQTVGINYVFDAELGGYVVYKSLNGEHVNAYSGTDKVVYVRAYYNDGVNGKKPVVAVGNKAFKDNKTIEKVILPASVTLLTNNAFSGCTSLTYVDARGWENSTYSAKLLGKNVTCDHIFGGCNALETIILGKSFDMSGNAWVFDSETAPSPAKLDIFISSSDGTFTSNSYDQRLLSGKVYHYNEDDLCGTWMYVQDGQSIVVRAHHDYVDGACEYCSAREYTVTAWGDSITFGEATSSNDKRYSNLLSEMLPINTAVNNQGLSGRKLIDEGVVDSIIADTSDVIIIALGTNDYAGAYNGRYGENAGLGKITDTDYANAESKTYYGALNALKEAFDKKDVKVIFLAPIGIHLGNQSQHGGTIADFGQAIKNVFGDDTTGKYTIVDGLEIISVSDIWNFSPDGVHVNDEAHKLIANAIFNASKDIFGMSIRG